jgi:hypothetical protein
MNRSVVIKSKSFTIVRRSKSNKSSSRSMTSHSYDDSVLPSRDPHCIPPLSVPCAHGNDSDSDSDDDAGLLNWRNSKSIATDDWSSWASSIGLPLTLIEYTTKRTGTLQQQPQQQQQFHNKNSTRTTKSQFKPSYLLQKRKQALVQHHQQQHASYFYNVYSTQMQLPIPLKSPRHSCWALLFLIMACYALFCLSMSDTPTVTATTLVAPSDTTTSATTTTTYYYLNMREDQPLEIIAIMLALHAQLFERQPHAHFAGVCGYPTYQQSSQQQAMVMLTKLRLESVLPSWDVCPPVDAILQDDPHHVLVEEQDVERGYHLFTPQWKQRMQEYRQQQPQQESSTTVNNRQHYGQQQQQPQQDARRYEAIWQQLISGTTTVPPNPQEETLQRLPQPPPPLQGLVEPQPHQRREQQQEQVGARTLERTREEQPVMASLQNLALGHYAELASSSSHIRRRRI